MATCEQLQDWLAEAEEAYHLLQMGGAESLISTGTKEVRYTSANAGDLLRYIGSLRAQVAACTGVAVAGTRHMIHFIPRDSGTRYRGGRR